MANRAIIKYDKNYIKMRTKSTILFVVIFLIKASFFSAPARDCIQVMKLEITDKPLSFFETKRAPVIDLFKKQRDGCWFASSNYFKKRALISNFIGNNN